MREEIEKIVINATFTKYNHSCHYVKVKDSIKATDQICQLFIDRLKRPGGKASDNVEQLIKELQSG